MADTQKKYLQEFGQATTLLKQRDYHSLAELVKRNPAFALEQGKAVVGSMYHQLAIDEKPFDHGYQLTGDQLQILAYARKAGAPVGEGDFTVHFDYVARIERQHSLYWPTFPDFPGSIDHLAFTNGETLKEAQNNAQKGLASYLAQGMLVGETLPKPQYHGRKTARVRPFKVQLTLKDLIFQD